MNDYPTMFIKSGVDVDAIVKHCVDYIINQYVQYNNIRTIPTLYSDMEPKGRILYHEIHNAIISVM